MRARTFIMIKPDGVSRKLIGNILSRFEIKGFDIVNMKMCKPSKELAKAHYNEHKEKPFFDELAEYISSGPIVACVLEGPEDTVALVRSVVGDTTPLNAIQGTIRGDLALTKYENIIHASDSYENAKKEIKLWFDKD